MSIAEDLKRETINVLSPILKSAYEEADWFFDDEDQIQLRVQMTDSPNSLTKLLHLVIIDKQVQLPIIYIPETFRKQGYGFGLIDKIRTVCNQHGYDFYIVDMVNSFYTRMIEKGAIAVDEDSVLVTTDTQLLQKRFAQ